MLRCSCTPESWLDQPRGSGSKARSLAEVSAWGSHLSPVIEMGWIGREVVGQCFRNTGMTGFEGDLDLCKVIKESKFEPISPKFSFSVAHCF